MSIRRNTARIEFGFTLSDKIGVMAPLEADFIEAVYVHDIYDEKPIELNNNLNTLGCIKKSLHHILYSDEQWYEFRYR